MDSGVQDAAFQDAAFQDAEVRAALEAIEAGLDRLQALDLDAMPGGDVTALMAGVERITRRASATQLSLLDAVQQRELHRADGHATAKTMLRHVGRLSHGEAAARGRSMRMCRELPAVRAAFRAGDIGVDHVCLLGRVHANPRVRHAMPGREGTFIGGAQTRTFREFELDVRQWERLVDMDGPEPANQRNHETRDAKLIQHHFDLSWDLAARYAAMQGASMREILDHYIEAELTADWEKARAEHGDDACFADLPRTDAQRRADALWQIFQDAAANGHGAVPPRFVHNIVWDAASFEEMLARIDGSEPHPLDPDTHRCSTIDGVPLEPTEAVVSSLVSMVRRVVVDAAGVVIDQGRARRFTGSARHAVLLADPRCVWPGCGVQASRCEIDHLRDHARGGRTAPGNGAPLCGRHNRWKQKGFTAHRDNAGEWHLYRPDGAEVE